MGPGNTPYCTPANLAQYLPAPVLALTTIDQQNQACADASEEADSYMRGRFEMPLLAWGSDVVRYTSWMACYLLVQLIGYAPQAGSDENLSDRYWRAVGGGPNNYSGWFPDIQRQRVHPDVTPTLPSPGNPVYDLPQVRSGQPRGWSGRGVG